MTHNADTPKWANLFLHLATAILVSCSVWTIAFIYTTGPGRLQKEGTTGARYEAIERTIATGKFIALPYLSVLMFCHSLGFYGRSVLAALAAILVAAPMLILSVTGLFIAPRPLPNVFMIIPCGVLTYMLIMGYKCVWMRVSD